MRPLDRLVYGQRVVVIDPQSWLLGRRGTVLGVNASGVARVRIERGIPREQWIILGGVEQEDVTMLLPHECAAIR